MQNEISSYFTSPHISSVGWLFGRGTVTLIRVQMIHTHTHIVHIFLSAPFLYYVCSGGNDLQTETHRGICAWAQMDFIEFCCCVFFIISCVINKHFMMIFLIHFNNFSPRAKHSTYLCIATHSIILRCKSHFNEIFNGVVVGFVFNIEQSIISMANWTHI